MIRPANFGFNPETAESNAFQKSSIDNSEASVEELAKSEFDLFVNKLRDKGVNVIVVEDTADPVKPDAVFPNNWISFHQEGTVITYPMLAPTRRKERRPELIDELADAFKIESRLDLSSYEDEGKILEGTGSMVFDRVNKVVYACLSARTSNELLDIYCEWMDYEKVVFSAVDEKGKDIYHTNVMMSMGEEFVVICMDSIKDEIEHHAVRQKFRETGKTIVEITYEQMNKFAGNMLQVTTKYGHPLLVMSQQAYDSLDNKALNQLLGFTEILSSPIDTIETLGGGSARCMMAEVFLSRL